MAKQKSSGAGIGTGFLGFVIIAGDLAALWLNYFTHAKVNLLQANIISAVGIFPRGLPWVLPSAQLAYPIILAWMLIVMLCGVGILSQNSLARFVFVILCMAHMITFIWAGIIMMSAGSGSYSFGTYFYVLVFPLLYIFLLARPDAKS